ncbi:hypothetical protein KBC99_00085 [Candidatus Saccharibacteria bacterium]|nr:hypothetical protein [Candidatus Saccharibacteria bacterium]
MTRKKKIPHGGKGIIALLMYGVAFFSPLSNLPQITKLYTTQVTAGISLQTWIMYFIFGLVPLLYAIANHIKPLIISNALWVIVEIIMIYGILKIGTTQAPLLFENQLLINTIGKTMAGIGLICVSSAAAIFAHDLVDIEKLLGGNRAN